MGVAVFSILNKEHCIPQSHASAHSQLFCQMKTTPHHYHQDNCPPCLDRTGEFLSKMTALHDGWFALTEWVLLHLMHHSMKYHETVSVVYVRRCGGLCTAHRMGTMIFWYVMLY